MGELDNLSSKLHSRGNCVTQLTQLTGYNTRHRPSINVFEDAASIGIPTSLIVFFPSTLEQLSAGDWSKTGESVLVAGGSTAVYTCAIQLLKLKMYPRSLDEFGADLGPTALDVVPLQHAIHPQRARHELRRVKGVSVPLRKAHRRGETSVPSPRESHLMRGDMYPASERHSCAIPPSDCITPVGHGPYHFGSQSRPGLCEHVNMAERHVRADRNLSKSFGPWPDHDASCHGATWWMGTALRRGLIDAIRTLQHDDDGHGSGVIGGRFVGSVVPLEYR